MRQPNNTETNKVFHVKSYFKECKAKYIDLEVDVNLGAAPL